MKMCLHADNITVMVTRNQPTVLSVLKQMEIVQYSKLLKKNQKALVFELIEIVMKLLLILGVYLSYDKGFLPCINVSPQSTNSGRSSKERQ